jgi:LPS export ABC transporter protein LptC
MVPPDHPFSYIVKISIAITLVMAMLVSCRNDMKKVMELTHPDTMPTETLHNLELKYSDSGYTKVLLKARLMYSYTGPEARTVFPEGLEILFLDSRMQVRSSLNANYGVNHPHKKLLMVKNDVVVINKEKNERLETEELIWDQRKQTIYTDAHVKISTPDKIIFGKGLEADESFRKRTIKNISGEVLIEENEEL